MRKYVKLSAFLVLLFFIILVDHSAVSSADMKYNNLSKLHFYSPFQKNNRSRFLNSYY